MGVHTRVQLCVRSNECAFACACVCVGGGGVGGGGGGRGGSGLSVCSQVCLYVCLSSV